MSNEVILSRARHLVELAKAANNQQNPDLALQHLKDAEPILRDSVGLDLLAELHLVFAEAFGAKGDAAAPGCFETTFEALGSLVQRAPGLELRANEHYGDYLCRFEKRPSIARERYVAAKRIATEMGLVEDSARIQLKITGLDLSADKDPEFENFRVFKRVSKELHATHKVQLAGWVQHIGNQVRAATGLQAARNKDRASEQYFRRLIESVKDFPE